MATKFEYYSSLAEETSGKLTKSVDQWTAFLRTAGRMSKYSYAEQLMIFAQRPDATACAEYDLWNSTMRRYVKRGAKGIALIDTRWDRPRLRYVFDVSDTGERKNSRTLNRWEMRDEYVRPVQEALEAVFDVSSASPFDVQIENIARWTADDYYQEHEYELDDIVAESYLEEYDEDNRRLSFINAAAVSIKYEILSRCTEEPDEYFDPDEFTAVFDYNTRKSINALGTAVSEISSQIFREIEVTIRSYERSRRTERSHDYGTELYAERGLSDSQHQTERDRERAAGQIRQDAQDVPERTSPDSLQRSDTDGAAVPASEGDRRDRTSQSGAADGRAAGEEPGTGQSDAADGMGTAYEQPESAGGGTGADRAGVQLTSNFFEGENSDGRYEQAFFFPSEAEQIEAIDRAAESEKPSAFSLAQTDIDHFLRLGGRSDKSRMIVAAEYMEGKSTEKIVDTLREEYCGGMGILTDNGRMSAWFGEEGIILARGDHARFAAQHQLLTWEDAAKRIGELMDAGEFATNVELAETAGNSRSELATSIWHLRHDFSDMTKGVPLLTTLDEYRGGGFPDEIEKLSSALADPDTLGAVTRDMLVFSAAYKNNPGILRFHYHDVPKILEQLQDLAAPWKEYTSEMTEVPKAGQFITEDEIGYALAYGSGVHGGKGRIYSFFSKTHQSNEAVSFLRDEYGIGGHSGVCINKAMSFENHDGKGIRLSKTGCSDVMISWNNVVKRIDKLIQTDHYLTDKEKLQMEQKDLIENVEAKASNSSLERAKDLIDAYCMDEFGSKADFTDMTSIGIGYTTVADRDLPIEVTVNLVEFRLERRLNERQIDTRQYDSVEALIAGELEGLDFGELTSVSEEEVTAAIREVLGEETPEDDEDLNQNGQKLYNVTEETTGVYPAETTGLPYTVEIRRMKFDDPKRDEVRKEKKIKSVPASFSPASCIGVENQCEKALEQNCSGQQSVLADLRQKAGQVPQPRRDSSYRRQEVL